MLPACRALRLTSTSIIHPAPLSLQSFSTFSTTSVKPTKTVLVTSATGRIGKEVVARLAKTPGFRVKAAVFTPSKAEYLTNLGADEVVHFDLQNAETWGEALKEVDCVYSASLDPLLADHLKFSAYLGTLKDQIKHVVRISCMGADTNTASYDPETHVSRPGAAIPLMLQHYWWGEKSLIDAGVPVTVLRNNFFMNHLLKTDIDQIDNSGWFSNPLGDARNSFVCTNDIGEAAALCLQEGPESHADKFYDLTGPTPQSMHEVAGDLGEALGKTVSYRPQSFSDFEADFGPTRAEFFEYLTNGFYTRCSPDFYNLTGRRPTSYKEYLTIPGAAGETGLDELRQDNLWKKGEDAMKEAASTVSQ
ncbi:hypothetical protein TrVE_jg11499 [Triparma verrucosa]|uniref:NmrA-like domain-containing protein n=1 Tax=Triparma verrucosa TaxID=1606542 RepID=A0A9W7C4Z8_9STRA|nr:hypothetical protein TrVE_jg11499 [Triparma verrucosa]